MSDLVNLLKILFGDLKILNISYSFHVIFFSYVIFLNPRKLLSVSFNEIQEAVLQF